MGVGMPGTLLLHEFGEYAYRAFGYMPYHVGSSLIEKSGWRDVDVRIMIPDKEWDALGMGDPRYVHTNKRWCSIVLVWSAFGRMLTNLPIDFQLQRLSDANEVSGGKPRSALFRLRDVPDAVACPLCNVVNCDHGERAAQEVKHGIFSLIDGFTPVDPVALEPFTKEMKENVIPEIIETMNRRAIDAIRSRQQVIKRCD